MQNQTLLQYFHWYYNEPDNLWTKAAKEAQKLKELGFTGVWFPPAYKGGGGGYSVGYDAYDLYDLGEFNQKGSISTTVSYTHLKLKVCKFKLSTNKRKPMPKSSSSKIDGNLVFLAKRSNK